MGLLSLCLITPAVGAIVMVLLGRRGTGARVFAFASAFVTFVISLAIWSRFDVTRADYQMVESLSWIPSLGAFFVLGVDGISLFLILLTTFVVPLLILVGWEPIDAKATAYFVHLLLLEGLVLGFFMAVDVFLLYVFWTAMLVPIALLIEIWGGERGAFAATKFFAYNMAGNVLVLAVILFCYHVHAVQSGGLSFDIRLWTNLVLHPGSQNWLFLATFVGFAVQMAFFPFHLWHSDALAGAPTAGGVMLAGIFLKVGAFGLIRIAVPLFPQAARSHETAVVILAITGILLGSAWSCLQRDMRRRLAWVNVTHMGLITLGIFSFTAVGVEGALYLMLSHGLFVAGYLILVDRLNERWCTYRSGELGGLWRVMPFHAVLFLLVAMAAVGIPGLNGFVGIVRILQAWLDSAPHLATVAGLGVLIAGLSILKTYKEAMLGPLIRRSHRGRLDLGWRELFAVVPLVLVIVWMGLSPQSFLGFMERSVEVFVSRAASGAVFPE